eukprot:2460584-Rhodomonas_salina.3
MATILPATQLAMVGNVAPCSKKYDDEFPGLKTEEEQDLQTKKQTAGDGAKAGRFDRVMSDEAEDNTVSSRDPKLPRIDFAAVARSTVGALRPPIQPTSDTDSCRRCSDAKMAPRLDARKPVKEQKAGSGNVDIEIKKALQRGAFSEVEKIQGERKMNRLRKEETWTMELISKLRRKSKYDFFDAPVDPEQAPGYFADSVGRTTWGTEAMSFQRMKEKAAQGVYDEDIYTRTSKMEADLTILVLNAIIYNPADHPVNKAALALYKAVRPLLSQTVKATLMCRSCHGDESFAENPVQICEFCCAGVHFKCQGALTRADSDVCNPLQPERTDAAWFCSDLCEASFKSLVGKCLLPPSYCRAALHPAPPRSEDRPVAEKITEPAVLSCAPEPEPEPEPREGKETAEPDLPAASDEGSGPNVCEDEWEALRRELTEKALREVDRKVDDAKRESRKRKRTAETGPRLGDGGDVAVRAGAARAAREPERVEPEVIVVD